MRKLDHAHDGDPSVRGMWWHGTGFELQTHVRVHHPGLAAALLKHSPSWPAVSGLDEEHKLEHRFPLYDGDETVDVRDV